MDHVTPPTTPGSAQPAMTKVSLERLRETLAYLASIESTPLENITWYANGRAVALPLSLVTEWKFTGLNNRDFAREYLLKDKRLPI